eukprot:3644618-Rhodomonas_salina.1
MPLSGTDMGPEGMLCPGLPQSIELDERRQQELVVGRDFANRSTRINFLHLDSNAREFKGMLSRPQHARFFFDLESSKWTIQDLDSRNGVFVNNEKVTLRQLNLGDQSASSNYPLAHHRCAGLESICCASNNTVLVMAARLRSFWGFSCLAIHTPTNINCKIQYCQSADVAFFPAQTWSSCRFFCLELEGPHALMSNQVVQEDAGHQAVSTSASSDAAVEERANVAGEEQEAGSRTAEMVDEGSG